MHLQKTAEVIFLREFEESGMQAYRKQGKARFIQECMTVSLLVCSPHVYNKITSLLVKHFKQVM